MHITLTILCLLWTVPAYAVDTLTPSRNLSRFQQRDGGRSSTRYE